jgi:Skp family chaperone for outer membrane proteins
MKSFHWIARGVLFAAVFGVGAPVLAAQDTAAPAAQAAEQVRPLKIAVINGIRVLAESNVGKAVQAEGEAANRDWESRVRAKQTELDTLVRQVQEQRLTLTEDALARMNAQAEQLQVDLTRTRDDANRAMNRFATEAQNRINAQLIPAVERLAAEAGYDLILDTRVEGILYFADAIDATDRFIQMVNAQGGGQQPPGQR